MKSMKEGGGEGEGRDGEIEWRGEMEGYGMFEMKEDWLHGFMVVEKEEKEEKEEEEE